ncbi:MAG: hypothetical protein A4E64_01196 [Syntrophorhabdus sp. PtaU1.Bin058]|nr:MAG: hypothetical protein A4E64_01196 [Syntrophorhabdus sp. PtaU1.Bin058]
MFDERFEERQEVHRILLSPGDNRAVAQREVGIGDDKRRVEIFFHAEAETRRAGAVWIIEGEHPRRYLRIADAAVRTGEPFAEDHRVLFGLHLDDPVGLVERQLHRLEEPPFDAVADRYPVDDDVDIMLFVLVQLDVVGEVNDLLVQLYPGEPLFPQLVDLLPVFALPSPDNGRQDSEAFPLTEREDGIDDLGGVLALDLLSAAVAVDVPDPREEEPQVIVDLRYRPDGAPGVLADALLFDADGRGQPLYVIHVRFFHKLKELPGIGGEGFHVPPLSFGVDGVECKC